MRGNFNDSSINLSKKVNPVGFFKLMKIYYKQYLWHWFLLVIFVIITSGITVAIPKLTNIVMNELMTNIFKPRHPGDPIMPWLTLLYWAIGFGMSFVISGFFLYLRALFNGSIGRKVEIQIRLKVLNKLVDLNLNYYHNKKMGDILTKLISDTQILGEQISTIPVAFLSSLFTFLGSIIIMFTLNNKVPVFDPSHAIIGYKDNSNAVIELSGIILAVAFGILLVAVFGFGVVRKLTYKQRQVISEINGDISDRINNIRLIKSTGTSEYEKNRFINIHKNYYKVSMKTIKTNSWIIALVITILTSLNTIDIIVGIIFINQGKLDPTILLPITMSINALIFPIIGFVNILGNLANASTAATRIDEILKTPAKIVPNLNAEPLKALKGNIEFRNVSFKYDENDSDNELILKNFNFIFEEGKTYAIVGQTGYGKSTIAKLILRYYDPTSGDIFINNNINLKNVNLNSYLNFVGYVEQEPQILFGSFFENIVYGKFNATLQDVIVAVKKAELYDFIDSLPNKFDTILGERGFVLSGGQKQRLVIARMFLKDPSLLILDEATSSLDNIVEKEIQQKLNELMKNRTSIIIAHRLSTIRNVDKILVIEKQKGILQSGTFDELKNIDGHFKRLYDAGLVN